MIGNFNYFIIAACILFSFNVLEEIDTKATTMAMRNKMRYAHIGLIVCAKLLFLQLFIYFYLVDYETYQGCNLTSVNGCLGRTSKCVTK